MRRVVILGISGGGKSRLARSLGTRLQLPVVHLDPLYYGPGWAPGDPETFRRRVRDAVAGDRWIVDGAFLALIGDITLPRADLVVWLEQPRWLALTRALRRCFDGDAALRADLPAGCRDTPSREMMADIWTFETRARPDMERRLAALAPGVDVRRLRGDRAAVTFMAELSP